MFVYFLNFVFVTGAIIAFIAPFFFVYWLAHPGTLKTIGFNRYFENFISSKYANWLVFFWAAGEALFWFVLPEFLLVLVMFMRVHKKRQMLIADILGTVFGTLVAYAIRFTEHLLTNIPYVVPEMITKVHGWYDQVGLLALSNQPFSGVPYKVFVNIAWQYDYFIFAFLFIALIARISRYIIVYGMLVSLYPYVHKLVYRHYVTLFLLSTLIFSILLYNTVTIYLR